MIRITKSGATWRRLVNLRCISIYNENDDAASHGHHIKVT